MTGASSTRDREELAPPLEGEDPAAPHAFDHDLDVAVGQLERLGDGGDDADVVDVLGLGLVELRVLLRGQEEPLGRRREGRLEGADRGLAAHDEGLHHVGEDDHVPQRDERQALQPRVGSGRRIFIWVVASFGSPGPAIERRGAGLSALTPPCVGS